MTKPQQQTTQAPEKPKAASFFSGIGGFDWGFQEAGFEISFQCEIDDFCTEILEKHWPGVRREKNIKELKELKDAAIPLSQVWLGGFPCQDVSLARMGPRAGLKGARSGLFHDFAELLDRGRPQVCLLENVPGLLSSHEGRDFGTIIQTLADIGYSLGWRVLNSKNFGVPQSRSRVYIVGCYRDRRGPVEILFEPECGEGDAEAGESPKKAALSPFKESIGNLVKGPVFQRIAYCLYACSARHTGTDWSRTYVTYPEGRVRRLMPRECEGVMGFPEGWTRPVAASHADEDPDDIDTLRYQALGNAVTPPVAKWLAGRIKRYLGMKEAEDAQAAKPSRPARLVTEDAAIAACPAAAAPPV
jgi:DNA (cytosine-5)-methyltransferase 1